MTDRQAERALAALANEPYPWAVPGARCRHVIRGRVSAGVVTFRDADHIGVLYDGFAHQDQPWGVSELSDAAADGDVFEPEESP